MGSVSTEERMYELGKAALEEQERSVSELRGRIPPLLAGAAVLGTLLAKPATEGSHPDSTAEWISLIAGSVCGVGVLVCCSAVFGLYRLGFTPDPKRTYEALRELDLAEDPDQRDLALAMAMSNAHTVNDSSIRILRWLLVAALVFFVFEALLLGTAAALTS